MTTNFSTKESTTCHRWGEVTEQEITRSIELEGCEPAVWRRVVVASTDSLEDLHWVIQSVFGWADDHTGGRCWSTW